MKFSGQKKKGKGEVRGKSGVGNIEDTEAFCVKYYMLTI